MATYSITSEINEALAAGYTIDQIRSESTPFITEGEKDGTWLVNGKPALATFTRWYDLHFATTFTKHEGEWVIKGRGLVEGEWVEVAKRDGTTTEKHIREIISDTDGVQIARIY